jgi:hypothetical protein
MMSAFTTEDGNEVGYICAQCPNCLQNIMAAVKAKKLLNDPPPISEGTRGGNG